MMLQNTGCAVTVLTSLFQFFLTNATEPLHF